jgi:hypothetical protein
MVILLSAIFVARTIFLQKVEGKVQNSGEERSFKIKKMLASNYKQFS